MFSSLSRRRMAYSGILASCTKCIGLSLKSLHTEYNLIDPALNQIAINLENEKKNISLCSLEHSNTALEKSFQRPISYNVYCFIKYAWHTNIIENVEATEDTILGIRNSTELFRKSFKFGTVESRIFQKAHSLITLAPENTKTGFRGVDVFVRKFNHEIHVFPSHARVASLMSGFIHFLNSTTVKESHPIIRAALAKLLLVSIHPFSDGNGRTSRAVLNGLLRQDGYPFITIPVTENQRYYKTLQRFHDDRETEPYLNYIFLCIERALETFSEDLLHP